MKVKPSKRPKKRYIVFETAPNKLNEMSVHNAITKSAMNVLGNKYGEAGIRFLKDKYRSSINRGIIRVNNKYAKIIVEAINKNNDFKTIGISGILKKAEDRYMKIAL